MNVLFPIIILLLIAMFVLSRCDVHNATPRATFRPPAALGGVG